MSPPTINDEHDALTPALDSIRKALAGLRFGTVTLIVHDGVIVQVDRTEKLRLAAGGEAARRA